MKRVLLVGLTAAKKLLVKRWKLPHKLNVYQWLLSFYELLTLEASSAQAQGAKRENIDILQRSAQKVKSLL